MATVKELLRTETLAGGARGSAIDTSAYISFTPPAKGESVDYIAPCDGVVRVNGEYATKTSWNSIWMRTNDAYQNGLALEGSTGWIAFGIRVKKGDKVTVGASGETSIGMADIYKVIGGGHKRYLPSLSRNRFGGALWLRLKTTSETLRRLGAGSHFQHRNASLSKPSRRHPRRVPENTTLHQTAFSSSGLRPSLYVQRFGKTAACTYFPQIKTRLGQRCQSRVFEVEGLSTRFWAPASSKERPTSFLLSVASNNARMEVAA